jgi:hypothetical protein
MSINFVVEQTDSVSTKPAATIMCAIIRITGVRFALLRSLPPRTASRQAGDLGFRGLFGDKQGAEAR